ncbi:MAG: hypothetical protein IPI67_24215 [Myxococcales bacterium]|nr:hypothetical protein [Myxococcales bacterium]
MRLALVLAVVVSLNAAPARACDPGPIFVVRVESADAPECLERSPVKNFARGVRQRCRQHADRAAPHPQPL